MTRFSFFEPCETFFAGLNGQCFKQPNTHRNRHPTMDAARRERKIAPRRKHHKVPRLKDLTVKNQTIGNLLALENKAQSIRMRNAVQNLGASLHAKLQDDRDSICNDQLTKGLDWDQSAEIHRRPNNHVRILVKAKAEQWYVANSRQRKTPPTRLSIGSRCHLDTKHRAHIA